MHTCMLLSVNNRVCGHVSFISIGYSQTSLKKIDAQATPLIGKIYSQILPDFHDYVILVQEKEIVTLFLRT